MKLLILGLDGGERRILEALDMPYLEAFLSTARHVSVVENLMDRGWAKILSGKSGADTGAFYTKPAPVPGGCTATQSFRSTDYDAAGVVPLWRRINDLGKRVGIMNVPTTFPAPEVNGFFVAGAGGGLGTTGGVVPGICAPFSAADILKAEGYIVDTRFVDAGITDPPAYFRRLSEMTERRFATYRALDEKYMPDFGFVALMATKSLQYLAMSEFEELIASRGKPSNSFQTQIVDLYRTLDAQIKRFVDALQPEHVILTSDHGQAPYLYKVDVNSFLIAEGLQAIKPAWKGAARRIVRDVARGVLPVGVRTKLKRKAPSLKQAVTASPIDLSSSKAFGIRYVSGIYINDSRFGGVVADGAVGVLIDSICKRFNAAPEAKMHGLAAIPYRRNYFERPFQHLLPDVWIEHPDTMFFEFGIGSQQRSDGRLVQENPVYGPIVDLAEVVRDQWTGIKGRYPLLAASNNLPEKIFEGLAGDLTAVYQLTVRIMAQ